MIGSLRVPQFLAKQEKQNRPALNDAAIDTVMDSSLQIRGTDTPPEKCHVRFFRRRPRETTTEEVLPKELRYEGRGEYSSLPWYLRSEQSSIPEVYMKITSYLKLKYSTPAGLSKIAQKALRRTH
ncbi:hypothetical protein CFP56_010382 [Quercus suber]|uniref:Uncharacterized protein n=1 Tax=Quercus suber TaxID=58331 RepID=A0AAW0L376_QUESU